MWSTRSWYSWHLSHTKLEKQRGSVARGAAHCSLVARTVSQESLLRGQGGRDPASLFLWAQASHRATSGTLSKEIRFGLQDLGWLVHQTREGRGEGRENTQRKVRRGIGRLICWLRSMCEGDEQEVFFFPFFKKNRLKGVEVRLGVNYLCHHKISVIFVSWKERPAIARWALCWF